MTKYYEILDVPRDASKHKVFRAFRKRYLRATHIDDKINLLTGFLLVANERRKFLDILIDQQEKGKPLTAKYQRVLAFERSRAESLVNNPIHESRLQRIMKAYPLKEAVSGLFLVFLYGADRYYFELSYLLFFIGAICLFQDEPQPTVGIIGALLIASGIYAHIKIVWNVKINKITLMPATATITNEG